MVAALAVVVAWCVFASTAYFTSDARLSQMASDYTRVKADRDFALQRAQEADRDKLLASMASKGSLALIEAQRRESAARLEILVSESHDLRARVAALTAEVDDARPEKERLVAARDALLREGEMLRSQLAQSALTKQRLEQQVAGLTENLGGARSDNRQMMAVRDDLLRERDTLQGKLDELGAQKNGLEQRTAMLGQQLKDVEDARDKMNASRAGLEGRISELQQKLENVQDAQKALVQRISARVTVSSNAAERTIAMTGLDANRLLRQLDQKHGFTPASEQRSAMGGMGGPFVAFRPEMVDQSSKSAFRVELDRMVAALDNQADRRDGLERVIARLPLAAPLDEYQVMSPFGQRIDPINGKLGFHTGIDLAGAVDAPVLATAAGMVVFAGHNGGYGNVVEVDHGMGVHTRYAHLRKILVKVGQKIPLRGQIGIVGSTGRSTGTHVHYEIVVEDQPYDPAKFLRAGLNVFSKD